MSLNKVPRITSRKSLVFRAVLTGLLLVVLCPSRAEAHLNSTGMGPVYDGIAHFLLSPEDLVPVLALSLLAGLRGAGHGRRALLVLPVAWLLGGFIGLAIAGERGAGLTALSFLLIGGLVATDARVSLPVLTLLAASFGLFHGYLNGAAMQQAGLGTETLVVVLMGLVLAVFALVTLAAAVVVRLQRQWARIAIRVVGSWIVASGLLMVGWAARKG